MPADKFMELAREVKSCNLKNLGVPIRFKPLTLFQD
jgi:hypothetical protein